MLKLHQIYLKKLLPPFVILFVIIGAVVHYAIKDIYISQTKDELISDANIISLQINEHTNFDKFAKKVRKADDIRVTFIRDDGLVLGESNKDKSTMDNHKLRPEIIQARKKGLGSSIRHSHTLDRDLIYVAKKLDLGGEIVYVRVAKFVKKIYDRIFYLGAEVLALLVLFFVIVFYSVYKINKDLEKEVDKISAFLVGLSKKKKPTYIKSTFSKEFFDITSLLTKVSQVLSKRDKQKAKYTKKLKLLNAQKDEILSAISHEFKNPITVINGYSQTLLDDKDINEAIREKFLKKIYSSGKRLSELIDTLRLALKLDSDKIKLTFAACNVYEIAKESCENLLQIYNDTQIEIKGRDDLIIEADKVLLGVAITNLMENAIKYSEDKVEVIIADDYITIKDNGIGIEEKELKNITKKFYRISKNSWDNSLGLGLSIVSNILNLHKFKLLIKSQKHEGSEFSIKF